MSDCILLFLCVHIYNISDQSGIDQDFLLLPLLSYRVLALFVVFIELERVFLLICTLSVCMVLSVEREFRHLKAVGVQVDRPEQFIKFKRHLAFH
jgi:hypothetical protein